MVKRTGADAWVAESAVQTVEKAPTWSSPGRSNHFPLVPCVRCSWCCHLKQGHNATYISLYIASGKCQVGTYITYLLYTTKYCLVNIVT